MIWYLIALAALVPWVVVAINGRRAMGVVPHIRDLSMDMPVIEKPAEESEAPADEKKKEGDAEAEPEPERNVAGRLSVVIAARNEAAGVEKALRSLMDQTHPDYEVIIVNDRSTDETGAIIDRVAAEFPGKIRAEHVTELPEGWLGKCNALHVGGELASGDYILFTDGDVEFEGTVLQRAYAYAAKEEADQFCVFAEMKAGTFLEKAMVNVFALCFMFYYPPHRTMTRNSGRYVGIGAFNMVRTEMYRKIQGHSFLRLQVVDDMGLGRLIKFSGGKVRLAWGSEFVTVRWQPNLAETIKGLEKNFFAAANYRLGMTIAAVVGVLIMFLWPWIGVWAGPTGARVIAGLALALQIFVAGAAASKARFSPVHGLTAQVGGVLLVTAIVRSAYMTLKQGGIRWRDTFYPLKDIKQFKL